MSLITQELKTQIQLRNDSKANWDKANPILAKGEIGIDIDNSKFKIGDGITTWANLSYINDIIQSGVQNTYQDNITTDGTNVGDIAVVKTAIADGKESHTAYVWDGSAWKAMDGNYNAENVYFDEDLVSTYAVGNISLTNGQGIVSATGKNLKEVWNAVFQKKQAPTITGVSSLLSAGPDNEVEIGSKISKITWDGSFSAGSYSFGSVNASDTSVKYSDTSTGVTRSWAINYALNETGNGAVGSTTTATTEDGTFELATPFQVNSTSSKTYATVNGTVTWIQSPRIPINNLGEQVEGRIAGGEKDLSNGVTITGYRKMFCGTIASKAATLGSADIRALTGKADKVVATTFTFTVPVGALRVICAVPKGFKVTACKDKNGFDTDLISTGGMGLWTANAVYVKGANNFAVATNNGNDTTEGYLYNVYYQDLANPNDTVNTYTVTVAAE